MTSRRLARRPECLQACWTALSTWRRTASSRTSRRSISRDWYHGQAGTCQRRRDSQASIERRCTGSWKNTVSIERTQARRPADDITHSARSSSQPLSEPASDVCSLLERAAERVVHTAADGDAELARHVGLLWRAITQA